MSQTTQHTPGLLHIGDTNPNFSPKIYADDKRMVADCGDILKRGQEEAWENARRLVACWNACHGISTDALEGGIVARMVQNLNASSREAVQW